MVFATAKLKNNGDKAYPCIKPFRKMFAYLDSAIGFVST
jgi:hypothetical protein